MQVLPNRRWLTYSVRTLLVAVTIFCVWLAWQVSIVRERKALRAWAESYGMVNMDRRSHLMIWKLPGGTTIHAKWERILRDSMVSDVPWYRNMLGDQAVDTFCIHNDSKDHENVARIEKLFPEAAVGISVSSLKRRRTSDTAATQL